MHNRAFVVLVLTATAALAAAAAAQDGEPPPAGRFQLSSGDNGGFVRLDTRTGTVAHCSSSEGVWRCEPILDSGLADRLMALSDKVERLSTDLDGLSSRVGALATGVGAPPPVDEARARPSSFARMAVHRLLEVIRTLKYGRADAT